MNIQVGVNENVLLKGAEINDKGTLTVSFTTVGFVPTANTTPVDDLLLQMSGAKPERINDGTVGIMLFAPSVEFGGEKRTVEQIATDLGGLRDQLQHLLRGYLTSDQAVLDPYVGIDTSDPSAVQASMTNQNTVDRIYKNLTTQFVVKVAELNVAGRLAEPFRLLLVRRSGASHYGTFRKRFISNNPFWESMAIPAASSALKFTKYEIGKGLNSGEPVAKDAGVTTDVTNTVATGSALDSILGSR